MAIKRQNNWLGGQRVDTVHLRSIESAVVSDFDDLCGKLLASSRPIVVSGMTINMAAAVGAFATGLILNTANSVLLHGTASESGAIFVVGPNQPAEMLSTSNLSVVGSFTPNSTCYIGIDLIREVDQSTADIVKFRSSTTKKEFSQEVPLARTLQYRIVVSTSDFDMLTNVAPVAKVALDVNGLVLSVTDCREMLFRLGSGGTVPNPLDIYSWIGGRTENPVTSTSAIDPFVGADKSIASFVSFFHALESRLWEVGGGEHWYSQTSDRDVLFARDSLNTFVSNNENFEFDGTNVHWKGISFNFGNSTATYNLINDQLTDVPGLTDLAVGQCLYVDVDRAANSTLTMVKANLTSLGVPAIPGSRHIIAYRTATGAYATGSPYPIGYAFIVHSTASAWGITRLWAASGTDATVPATDVNGIVIARGLQRDTSGILKLGAGSFDTEVDISLIDLLTKVAGSLYVAQNLVVDNQNVNNGDLTNSLRFGGIASTEGIASKRSVGGNQYGLDLYTASTARLSISTAGVIDAHSNKIQNLALCTVNADAANKGYVDGYTTGTIIASGNFNVINCHVQRFSNNIKIFYFEVQAISTGVLVCTLPSGYRPDVTYQYAPVLDRSTNVFQFVRIDPVAGGVIFFGGWAPVVGHVYNCTITYW